jgi:tetratricopeptide (TPR) repeat protein
VTEHPETADPETEGPEAAARHADVLVGSGRVAAAVPVLTSAVAVHPQRAELWGRLAAVLLAVGRLREAWDAAARTVELAPGDPEAHRTIGSVALAMQAWPQAEIAFRHVLTLNPGDAAAQAALARIPATRAPRRAAEGSGADDLRVGFVRWVRAQWLFGVATYLGLAYGESAPYLAGALTLVLVLLGAFGRLRWQALPEAVRAEIVRLPRQDPGARLLVGLALAGALGIVVVVPASMLGALAAARLASIASVTVTAAAAVLVARDRQAAAAS